jgi:RNA polymerase sigma-70 factor (ECF subfamily)
LKHSGEKSEEQLLVEAAQKDPSRFAELYESHFERVYAFVARRIRNRHDAQDLTADVFHHALANLGRFEWRGSPFASWLLRIAANAVADWARRTPRQHPNPALENLEDVKESEAADLEEVEERARLFQLVHALPADQRRVILQRFVEQKSIRAIAQELQRTEGAVKQLQLRALKNLQARMRDANG